MKVEVSSLVLRRVRSYFWASSMPVSYTHLDVYKRQGRGKAHLRGGEESRKADQDYVRRYVCAHFAPPPSSGSGNTRQTSLTILFLSLIHILIKPRSQSWRTPPPQG